MVNKLSEFSDKKLLEIIVFHVKEKEKNVSTITSQLFITEVLFIPPQFVRLGRFSIFSFF